MTLKQLEVWQISGGVEKRRGHGQGPVPVSSIIAGALPLGTAVYPVPASNVVFVSTTGSDSNTGSSANPYRTVAHAISASSSGTTIVVRAGSYHEAVTTPATKSLTIQSYPGEVVWFDGQSNLSMFLIASGPTNLLGLGFKSYKADITAWNAMVAFAGSSDGTLIENCIFDSSGMDGLKIAHPNITVRWCTFRLCQRTGFQGTVCDNGLVTLNASIHNNKGGYPSAPETAGFKFTRCDMLTVSQNWVEDLPNANGIWFDVYCTRMRVACNVIKGETGTAPLQHDIQIELCDGGNFAGVQNLAYVVGNKCSGANYAGAKIYDSGFIHVGNNDFRSCSIGAWFQQDSREHTTNDYRTPTECPAHCLSNPFVNNIYNGATGVLAYDSGKKFNYLGGQMLGRFGGNWSSGTKMAELGQIGGSPRTTFANPADLATAAANVGGPLNLGTNSRGATQPPDSIAEPLTRNVASLLNMTPNDLKVGPNESNLPILRTGVMT